MQNDVFFVCGMISV